MRAVQSPCNSFRLLYRDAKVCCCPSVVAFSAARWTLRPGRCVSCEAEAGRDSGDRSVPRRLSGPLPRLAEDGEWIQSVSQARGVLQRLLLRLCEHEDGSWACDDRDGSVYG